MVGLILLGGVMICASLFLCILSSNRYSVSSEEVNHRLESIRRRAGKIVNKKELPVIKSIPYHSTYIEALNIVLNDLDIILDFIEEGK